MLILAVTMLILITSLSSDCL